MLRRLKILAIEDSAAAFTAIRLAMRPMPAWSIERASDVAAALTLCASLDPDVISLDLGLPGGGGLELISTIKSAFDLPIVVVSASTYEGSPVVAEALRRGADACFDKAHLLTDSSNFLGALSDAAKTARKRPRRSAA